MKYIIILFNLLAILLVWGCEKNYDNVIDNSVNTYQVNSIEPIQDILYNNQDSSITVNISFSNVGGIAEVYASVIDPVRATINNFRLYDNGSFLNNDLVANDLVYSNYFFLGQQNLSGRYQIDFSVVETGGSVKKVGVQYFNYDNNIANVPPIISDLDLIDTISRGEVFIFTIKAIDSNGMADIKKVYFELFRPDGSIVIDSRTGLTEFQMFDDGNLEVYGDAIENDGIFSFKNLFGSTAQIGAWKFVFHAIDLSNSVSNGIEKIVVVN